MDKEEAKKKIVIVSSGISAKKIRIPKRIEDISLKWLVDAPFFSEFLLRFVYHSTEDIPTIAVNSIKGRINLYINEKFMEGNPDAKTVKHDADGFPIVYKDKNGTPILDEDGNIQIELEDKPIPPLTDIELESVLAHEIMHLVRMHIDRADGVEFSLFNVAADMCINEEIRGTGKDYSGNRIAGLSIGRRKMSLPEGCLYIDLARKDGYNGELITEPIYQWLIGKREEYRKKQEQMKKDGKQQESKKCEACGGTGQKPKGKDNKEGDQDGNGTEPCDQCDGSGKAGNGKVQSINDLFGATYGAGSNGDHEILEGSDELSESTIKDVVDNARARGWGNVSGNFSSVIEELLKPAKINWKNLLRKHIMSHIYGHGTEKINRWSRRNRRSLPLPGKRKLSKRIVIGIDTSGSVGDEELKQFFTEIEVIVKDISLLTVVQWDTEVKDVWNDYKKGDYKKIKVKGRGGTSVQCMFDWMVENKRTKDLLLNFTDGGFYEKYDIHGCKNIWCCTTDITPPGGPTVKIDITT